MIQALMGNKCLGTFFQNGTAKMYFNRGLREEINIKLRELLVWGLLAISPPVIPCYPIGSLLAFNGPILHRGLQVASWRNAYNAIIM